MASSRYLRLNLASLILAAIFTGISSLRIGLQVQAFHEYQMDRDEAVHANRGLDIASAIQRGSITDLWFETVKPEGYPPVYGYLLGAWFIIVGASTTSARLFALLCYFLLSLVLWFSARQAFPRAGPSLYLVPPLFLISDNQHVVYAAQTMLELPAILLALLTLYFFVKSLAKPTPGNFCLTSLFAVLCFMTRYSHGLFLLGSLAICYLVLLRSTLRAHSRQIVLAWLPAVILLLVWLIILDHWQSLLSYFDVQQRAVNVIATQGYLFYTRQLLQESSGWLPLILIAISVLIWFKRRQVPAASMPYLIFFAFSFLVLAFRTHNILRFGTVLFPPLWILSVDGANVLLAKIKKQPLQVAVIVLGLICLLMLGVKNHLSLPARLITAYENTNTGVNDAYRFIWDVIHQGSPNLQELVMYGENDNWNAFALHFYLQSRCMVANGGCRVLVTGEREIRKGWPPHSHPPEEIDRRTTQALSSADYVVLFAKQPVIPAGWQSLSAHEFEFTRYKIKPTQVQVVVLRRE